MSVILYRHREALTVIARGSLHTTGFPNQFDYVGHLNRLGVLEQPLEATRETTVNWQATAALEVLSAWRGQANLLRATLESIFREKGGKKYEKHCLQTFGVLSRLLSRITLAVAEYTRENLPREYLNGEDITAVAIVLYSAEQLLLCLGDLYLLS